MQYTSIRKNKNTYKEDTANPTGVYLTYEELQSIQREAYDLKQKINSLTSNNISDSTNEINLYKQELQELSKQIDVLKEEVNEATELNRNLLRINKERSNAERHLRPKKQLSGYVLLQSQERTQRIKVDGKYKSVNVWEAIIQTPYTNDMNSNHVRDLFVSGLCSLDVMKELGVTSINICDIGEVVENESKGIYGLRLKNNYKSGYWELIINYC